MRYLSLTVAATLAWGVAAAQTAPAFDVSTVKPSHATDGHTHIYWHPENGGFSASNISLKGLLEFAYDLPESRMVGGPAWIGSDKWDLEAKASPEVDAQLHTMSTDAAKTLKRSMVQALLAGRFSLVSHRETRELPLYALVVLKGGPKFEHAKEDGTSIGSGNSHIPIKGGDSVAILAAQLARVTGRVVLDKTGLAGRYDIALRWTPDNGLPDKINGASSPEETNGPSIFTAVQEQLGLKLESQRGPVNVLVIDSVQPPTGN
jgi:uncharacterized protein (TIGR03435 family)